VAVMATIRRCRSPEGPWVLGASLRKQVYTTYPLPVDEVVALRGAAVQGRFAVETALDMDTVFALLGRHWRGVVYLPDGPALRHHRFDELLGVAGYVVVRGTWRGSADPGWSLVPITRPTEAVQEVTKALEVARTRWERGALGLR
jgi:hypothetical protein